MAEPMVIDVDELKSETPEMNKSENVSSGKKTLKRKRASPVESLTKEEIEARISPLREELDSLFKYYKNVLAEKVNLDLTECGSTNSAIACFLEESSLSLSKLVDEIYEKMKAREGTSGSGSAVTAASVKSSVVLIGQRITYGVPNSDADVLEDESETCLWCWETRDLKLMPKSLRETLKIRRTCRKKIHERITAVSGLIVALQKSENNKISRTDITKASEKLSKILNEADIRVLLLSMAQKNGADIKDNKETKREGKQLIKQLERNKREAEKEKKRTDKELQKEKLHKEKEQKRLQEEAEKEERRRKKEESEMKKHLLRQQEEIEKDQRRREKEEAEQRQKISLKKQATMMERFLKKSKDNLTPLNELPSSKATSVSSPIRSEKIFKPVTVSMDCALTQSMAEHVEDMRKLHLTSWRCLGAAIRSNKKQCWGLRRKPKREVIKELKLSSNRGLTRDDELSIEKFVDGWDETKNDGRHCDTNADGSVSSHPRNHRRKQLLQFDKCHRPAFYGSWPKKSEVVGPRHPLKKDPDLDYDIDSDDEWEEEEPGESLSDCDKDEEEESCPKAEEEDESEDGFFVPDGYLSENEGVQVDREGSNCVEMEVELSTGCKEDFFSEDLCLLLKQQKHLHKLTETALRKNQPLIITNLMHEKASLAKTAELTGTAKLEQICLQALAICVFPGGPSIEISVDNVQEEFQDTCKSISKESSTPVEAKATLLDSDLPQIVSTIQSCSQGINKVVESLQQKFPSTPKSQLNRKVREISDFVENRWQVKKDVLDKLNLTISPDNGGGRKNVILQISPEKSGGRSKTIASFFSKRCLPPAAGNKNGKPVETSPQSAQKPTRPVEQQHSIANTSDHQ